MALHPAIHRPQLLLDGSTDQLKHYVGGDGTGEWAHVSNFSTCSAGSVTVVPTQAANYYVLLLGDPDGYTELTDSNNRLQITVAADGGGGGGGVHSHGLSDSDFGACVAVPWLTGYCTIVYIIAWCYILVEIKIRRKEIVELAAAAAADSAAAAESRAAAGAKRGEKELPSTNP